MEVTAGAQEMGIPGSEERWIWESWEVGWIGVLEGQTRGCRLDPEGHGEPAEQWNRPDREARHAL